MERMGSVASTFTTWLEKGHPVRYNAISRAGWEAMSLARSMSSAGETAGKRGSGDAACSMERFRMKKIILQATTLLFVVGCVFGQNPPLIGDPYAARGRTKSPDRKYDWIVKEIPTIRYELSMSSPETRSLLSAPITPSANAM